MNRKQRRAAARQPGAAPDAAMTQRQLALALQNLQAGRADLAEPGLRQVLAAQPDHADALYALGYALQAQGRLDEAIASYRQSLAVQPRAVAVLCNLGNALQATGKLDEAVECYRRALALAPNDASVHSNLGSALKALGQLDAATASFERALALKPDMVEARLNLANAWLVQGRLEQAGDAYRALAQQRPDLRGVHSNLGMVLRTQGRMAEALEAYRRSLAINLADPAAHANLGNVLADLGRIDEACASYERSLALRPDDLEVRSNILMQRNYDPALAPAALLEAHRAFAHALPSVAISPHTNARDPERRLRIGYVSGDFGTHPVGYFVLPVLAAHDPARVELVGYSTRLSEDAITRRIRAHVPTWRSTVGIDDAALAAQMRADGIDILVDLSGHTAGNRLGAFARKPAPVQVTWLGYPATTGLDTIDYRLTDATADPPDADAHGTEAPVRLPNGFHCYVPPEDAPDVVAPARRPLGFGSFNNLSKVNDRVIAAWGRILAAVPESRLVLKARPLNDPSTRALYQAKLEAVGVAPERMVLLETAPSWHDHMAQYGEIDVALDPFPYNGTTTTCDALWMGVPVVTLRGDRHAARVGASLLARVGLAALVADDLDGYVATAVALAQDAPRRTALRTSLRARVQTSPLGDPTGFTRALEDAYRAMWHRWCAEPG
jgi:predicted O-linked N-acetylglucosamine transferase (SPINDLY family)